MNFPYSVLLSIIFLVHSISSAGMMAQQNYIGIGLNPMIGLTGDVNEGIGVELFYENSFSDMITAGLILGGFIANPASKSAFIENGTIYSSVIMPFVKKEFNLKAVNPYIGAGAGYFFPSKERSAHRQFYGENHFIFRYELANPVGFIIAAGIRMNIFDVSFRYLFLTLKEEIELKENLNEYGQSTYINHSVPLSIIMMTLRLGLRF